LWTTVHLGMGQLELQRQLLHRRQCQQTLQHLRRLSRPNNRQRLQPPQIVRDSHVARRCIAARSGVIVVRPATIVTLSPRGLHNALDKGLRLSLSPSQSQSQSQSPNQRQKIHQQMAVVSLHSASQWRA
jgi:hypothetical protein